MEALFSFFDLLGVIFSLVVLSLFFFIYGFCCVAKLLQNRKQKNLDDFSDTDYTDDRW